NVADDQLHRLRCPRGRHPALNARHCGEVRLRPGQETVKHANTQLRITRTQRPDQCRADEAAATRYKNTHVAQRHTTTPLSSFETKGTDQLQEGCFDSHAD